MASGFRFTSIPNGNVSAPYILYKIFQGLLFSTNSFTEDLANNEFTNILFITPPTLSVHIAGAVNASAEAYMNIYEGATVSDNGTPLPLTNRNRNQQGTLIAESQVFQDATVTDNGTQIDFAYLPGGSGSRAQGGISALANEFVLLPSTNYLIDYQNIGGASQVVNMELTFYETRTGDSGAP